MKRIMIIAVGGGIGAVMRYVLSEIVHHFTSPTFPWGTLSVNLLGCYLIGLVWQYTELYMVSASARILIMTGFLGAFTTFSTFSLETFTLLRDGQIRLAVTNQIVSVVFGLILVIAGSVTVRGMHRILH